MTLVVLIIAALSLITHNNPIKPSFNRSVSSQSLKRTLEGEENNTNYKKQKKF